MTIDWNVQHNIGGRTCTDKVLALFKQCVAVRMLFYESAAKVTKLPALKRDAWHCDNVFFLQERAVNVNKVIVSVTRWLAA